ncbi:MAG: hypothetical protein AB7J30_13190 [Hyphomicrobium sp.]|uniref:hypothetical protein n=1 Tax=Hyphomicrobium sp. TaxID=82 RepID=UPI003D1000F8
MRSLIWKMHRHFRALRFFTPPHTPDVHAFTNSLFFQDDTAPSIALGEHRAGAKQHILFLAGDVGLLRKILGKAAKAPARLKKLRCAAAPAARAWELQALGVMRSLDEAMRAIVENGIQEFTAGQPMRGTAEKRKENINN